MRRLAALLLLGSVSLAGARAWAEAPAPFVKVIQPGAEALVGEMLLGAVAGCKATGVALDRTRIVARYDCRAVAGGDGAGGGEVAVALYHPTDGAGALATTDKFALRTVPGTRAPSPSLVTALVARIRAREAGFRWVAAEAPGLGTVEAPGSAAAAPLAKAEPGLSPEQAEAFVAAAKQYRDKSYAAAFDAFVKLARQTPRHGVLGMIVASLASTSPSRERVEALRAEADAHKDDPLPQFIAGVAAHYCGHRNARTLDEKRALYRLAIEYLARTRPAYDFEPRVYVYLAVSHFRLGAQAEAERLIEAAIPLAQNDPDVYYCRAEIFQRADVKRSIADIERYLAMTDTLMAQGVPVAEDKHARVKSMLEYLRAVGRGERQPAADDELFDPVLPAAPAAPAAVASTPQSQAPATVRSPLAAAQAPIAFALLALALLVGLPLSLAAAARSFPVEPGSSGITPRNLVAFAVLGGALLRWLVAPLQMVTLYVGYLVTEQSFELDGQSHYGVASQALYHLLFRVLPVDHRVLMAANSVCGVLALPLWAAFGARLLGDRRIGAAFSLLLAFTPLFIKNDNSDANQVPSLLWLAGGLLLWLDYLESGARRSLGAALVLLTLAAIGRPELPLLVPLWVGTATLIVPWQRREPLLWAGLAVAALLVVPHALHVRAAAQALGDRDSLPAVTGGHYGALLTLLWTRNTVLTADLYPVALLPLAAASLYSDARRLRAVVLLAVAAALSLALYSFDLCRANMARVHVPGALLVTLIAAVGTLRAFEALGRTPSPGGARATLIGVLVATTIPTALALWTPTNEQAEEAMIRRALAALKETTRGPSTLVRFARVDRDRQSPGSEFTHHHFPDYLFRPPAGQATPVSITDWESDPDRSRPAFFYQGMRCYAEFRTDGTPPPRGDALQPACARLRDRFRLTPVFEEEVVNRGDVWLEYYGDAPRLSLGLYRIEAK